MQPPFVIVENHLAGGQLLFAQPLSIIRVDHFKQVPAALEGIDAALAAGHHVAGYFSYELGYALEPAVAPFFPKLRKVPLLWLGVFDAPQPHWHGETSNHLAPRVLLDHEWTFETYAERFDSVQNAIRDGDIYQANLTFRSRFRMNGDPLALYAQLRERSAARHCAYVDDGERQILSLSPELFFQIDARGGIIARPIKGTVARGAGPAADAAARAHLRTSPKERAENLMIVDLMRNDVGRIAEVGSIAVDSLFEIETYPTVHQMVSTVTGRLKPEVRASDTLRALFPCGSVTGAPKIRAMQIVAALETSPRGVYCGAIGYFAPDRSASFNVAIRTLTVQGGDAELGIGGAVVHDSRARAEYDECLLKARFLETNLSG